ncbi:MAG: TolC family protein [Planctomycetales bacterium]|nr:TolC family protein [Planctomycetales bacterium]
MAQLQELTRVAIVLIVSVCMFGCRGPQPCCDPSLVSRQLLSRTGHLPDTVCPGHEQIPPGVFLEDGLSEDEAVHTALTNNSLFQAAVAQLGMVGGDAKQASLIANPQMLIYFPTSAKEGQYTLYQPIESYLLRPARVKVANREYRRIGEQLVQNGLDVARDTRLAYIDMALAADQAALADEAKSIRQGIAELTDRRFQRGDISELETITARVDYLNATAAASAQRQAVHITGAQLQSLIGLPYCEPIVPLPLETPEPLYLDEGELIAQALACRPDYHAAQWNIAAVAQLAQLARWIFIRADGVLDIRNGPNATNPGSRAAGGLRFDIPIFNRNQGGILRADWELNAALHGRDAIRDQIIADVRTASRQLRLAQENLLILERDVSPALAEALEISRKGLADGGTDYLLVLQTTSQYIDARSRILIQKAAVLRALAQLDRAVGSNIECGFVDYREITQSTTEALQDVLADVDAMLPDSSAEIPDTDETKSVVKAALSLGRF